MNFVSRSQQLRKDEEFAVERIMGKQYKKYGNLVFQEYLVKWLDYSESEATWEPIMNLEGAFFLVAEYERDLRNTSFKEVKGDLKQQQCPGWSLDHSKETRLDFRSNFRDKIFAYPFSFPTSSSKEICRKEHLKQFNQSKNQEQQDQEMINQSSPDLCSNSFENIAQTRQLLQLKEEKIMKQASRCKVPSKKNNISAQTTIPSKGHFLHGDQPRKIVSCKREQMDLMFLVCWKPRVNGQVPENTYFSSQALQQYASDLLIDYYESKIKVSCKLENIWDKREEETKMFVGKKPIAKDKEKDEGRRFVRKKVQRTLLYHAQTKYN